MKKKLVLLLAGVLCVSALTACGGSKDTASDSTQKTESSSKGGLFSSAKEYTLSEAFSPESGYIWYYIDDTYQGKDAYINYVYTFEDGSFKKYDTEGKLTLGTVSKMTDEEILSKLHGEYAPVYGARNAEELPALIESVTTDKEIIDKIIETHPSPDEHPFYSNTGLLYDETYSEWLASRIKKQSPTIEDLMDKLNQVSGKLDSWSEDELPNVEGIPFEYEMQIYSDSTGNNVDHMALNVTDNARGEYAPGMLLRIINRIANNYETRIDDSGDCWNGMFLELNNAFYGNNGYSDDLLTASDSIIIYKSDNDNNELELYSSLSEPVEVYDSFYNGYVIGQSSQQSLVCRCDKDTTFTFDTIGTDGIVVDPDDSKQSAEDYIEESETEDTDTY